MAQDYKLNQSELTRLKRQQKLYTHYLPVLKLKQEQLQLEYNRIHKALMLAEQQRLSALARLEPYVKLLSDSYGLNINDVVVIEQIKSYQRSVAGVNIKTLDSIRFKAIDLPYFQTQAWLIRVLPIVHLFLHAEAHVSFLEQERDLIKRELRKAGQKVNLFDLVLIPDNKHAIKRIKISLGDEQVASISRGKIAKARVSYEH